jgi:hypothetical protein
MIGVLLALILAFVLFVIVRRAVAEDDGRILPVLMGAYALRMFLQLFLRDLPLFSGGMAGGDYFGYEQWAISIARIWESTGVHFVNADELPLVGYASLPPNLFALVIYLNGGPTGFGCTSVIAVCACLTCLNLYKLAVEFGADRQTARRWMTVFAFMPAFLYYTSDMYKDGLVVFLVLGAFGSALRLTRRFSLSAVVFGAVCLWALWYVRFYLIFLTMSPLAIGLAGWGSKSPVRPLMAFVVAVTVVVIVGATTHFFENVAETANTTYFSSVEVLNRDATEEVGSGVVFNDGGSPFGALGPKILYTLFSPFPWTLGSLGLQLGKVDVFIWYFLAYRAFQSARKLRKATPTTVLMFLAFIAPTTLMYATGMNNIGIIMRERLPVVTISLLLALIGWQAKSAEESVSQNVAVVPATPAVSLRMRGT